MASDQSNEQEAARLALLRERVAKLEAEIDEKERSFRVVSAQLHAKEAELRKITSSLGWRLLSRYGRIKYRYLMPVYRLLGLGRKRTLARQSAQDAAGSGTGSFGLPGKYDIICLPIIDWDFRFQRPQQLLTRFAQEGHRVFYINSRFRNLTLNFRADEINRNIYDVKLAGPAHLNFYTDEIKDNMLERLLRALEDLRCQAGIEDAVCLTQLPFWSPLAFAAQEKWGWKVVYDCLDEHSGFSTTSKTVLRHEGPLIARSDLVVATSRVLYNKAFGRAKQIVLLPNAADFEHFNQPAPLRPLSDLPKPIIGYYGAISGWFDIEMVRNAAVARPHWQFVLIGSTIGADVSSLDKLANVHLLGEQHYASLPGYLHQFDVACIPFLRNPLTEAANPVKFYEYLSAGKPVVALDLPELEPYREYFYPVRSVADFVPQVEAALKERSHDKVQARVEFARRNTWPDRYKELDSAIKQLYPKGLLVLTT